MDFTKKYIKYKFKYLQLKKSRLFQGGHYLEIPENFTNDKSFQQTGYFHPHERIIEYSNDALQKIFTTEYFVPSYITYLNKNITDENTKLTLDILMHDNRFVKLGICYMRVKGILQLISWYPNFINLFKDRIKEFKISQKFINIPFDRECIKDVLDDNFDLNMEYFIITVQLLLIHIINYVSHNFKMPDWLDNDIIIHNFVNLTLNYVDAYQTINPLNMIMLIIDLENVKFTPVLIFNLCTSICASKKIFEISNNLMTHDIPIIKL